MTFYRLSTTLPNMPFDSCSATIAGQRSGMARRGESGTSPIAELTAIQAILRRKLDSEELTPQEAAMLTRGYVEAEKLKRVIRGQAANTSQSIRSEPVKRGQSTHSTDPIEPLPSVQEQDTPSKD